MKKVTLLLALAIIVCTPFTSFAQNFPDFGIISAEEKNITNCSFDNDATAVILLDEAVSEHDEEYHLINHHHVRIKILKEKGFDEANISLRYYRKDDFEFIDMLEAVVINTDASGAVSTEKLSKKSFFKKDINERIGAITFAFPNVKVGSIIEYKYRSFMKHYGGLDDWYFQKELPVIKSKYTLTILPNREFSYVINKKPTIPIIVDVQSGSGKVYFEMNNIPALTDEPYMDAREDYLQKVTFQLSGYNTGFGKTNYMTSWDEVIKELTITKEFGGQLEKNIPGTGAFIDATKLLPTEEDKMKMVYNYVRSNMTWNDLYSKYAGSGVKDAWEKKTGNSGEINLILVNLLKDAGLEVYPVLVSERFHGKVNAATPFIDQFNAVFACVIIKERKYYLDATDGYTPAHVIPNDILNTTALIVNRKKGGLVNITNDSLQYSDYISCQMELDGNGTLSGDAFIESRGYSRIKRVSEFKTSGQDKYVNKHYQKNGITVKEFAFLNQENDSLAAEQKFKFNTNLTSSGGYLYLPLDFFSGFTNNPFIADNRFSNVNFGYKRTISTYTSINLPKEYAMDALPKPIKMTTPDNDIVFSRSVTYDKATHSLVCMLLFDFKKSLYTADEYGVLKEVYKKMFDFLKEPVVLKKK
ncbi:DUF3857 domain-containing protein [Ferruginibacter sp.]|nr:DUF3857 domain-containing protein [Ferruginibacter sp.]